MSEQTLKRLLVAVAVLVVVYAGVRAATAIARPGDAGGALGSTLKAFRGDSLQGMVAAGPAGQRLELRREGARWTVNGFPADSGAVDRLLRAAGEMAVVDLVARNAATHARLGVSTDSAWNVELRGRQDTVRLLVGGMGRRYNNAYVRFPEADEVYEVSGGLRGAATLPLADWRDKTIARLDTGAVASVLVERGRTRYTLTRADSSWRIAGTPADSVRARDILSELARFDAVGFPDDTATFAGRESRRVVALGTKGDTLASIDFAGDGSTWLARRAGNAQLYQVASYRLDRLTPPRDSVLQRGSR